MRKIRISIICATFILLMIGLIMVYSSSGIYANENYDDSLFFLKRHALVMLVGLLLSIAVMTLDIATIRAHAGKILIFSILLLGLVYVPGLGRSAGGARRWISLGILNVQPSEIAKLAVIIYLADFLDRRQTRITHLFAGFMIPLVFLNCVTFLILLEPDLGTAITIGAIGFMMIFIAGARLRHFAVTVLLFIPFIYYFIFSVPYRRRRIMVFINPWIDEKGIGFQIVQSFIALGSGGLYGVGLGQSKQKLFFLPAAHTDFISSIIGEELGFIGLFCVILLFAFLVINGMRAGFKSEDMFKKMILFGISIMIAFEVSVNIGVAAGALPTKGLPLPFISYGGTSLVMHMISIGLLLNATRE